MSSYNRKSKNCFRGSRKDGTVSLVSLSRRYTKKALRALHLGDKRGYDKNIEESLKILQILKNKTQIKKPASLFLFR